MIHLLYITIYEKQNQDNIDVNIFSPSTIKINLVLVLSYGPLYIGAK